MLLSAVLLAAFLYSAAWLAVAGRAGAAGRAELLAAQTSLEGRQLDAADAHLVRASRSFHRSLTASRWMGGFGPVVRAVPLVRVQARGVTAIADAGERLATAGRGLVAGGRRLTSGSVGSGTPAPGALVLPRLRTMAASLDRAVTAVDGARRRIDALQGLRLFGPLGSARGDLARRLPSLASRVHGADTAVRAALTMLGDAGPRRYLVVTQNPDEPRPTGGFIGTYGVLTSTSGRPAIDRFESIESWYQAHPEASVAAAAAPTAFRIPEPPTRQNLSNVNATPDWPASAGLAMRLWRQGGEAPVDGVVSMTPQVLVRVLAVIGPVDVPLYGETVDANNLLDRLDAHTHLEATTAADQAAGLGPDRKRFVGEAAKAVLSRVLSAPPSSWDALARALAAALARRELLAYDTEPSVEGALAASGWDGRLPSGDGDFFFDGEFSYAAKNGRFVKRTFDHHVEVAADGSATVTTKVTVTDTAPAATSGLLNVDTLSYLTVYGPAGATLDRAVSDPPDALEPSVGGHPAAGWDRAAPPGGSVTFTVAWQVPSILVRRGTGWAYRLRWLPVVAHAGDTVALSIDLHGWRWAGPTPPASFALDGEAIDRLWPVRR